jgi:catalase (peroxidase I)
LVTDGGRHIVITGPLSCTAGERAFLRVTVTQRETGAIAEGHTLVRCSGDIRQWEVHATVRGAAVFQQGLATAAALARTSAHGDISDSHQWLVNITLVAD